MYMYVCLSDDDYHATITNGEPSHSVHVTLSLLEACQRPSIHCAAAAAAAAERDNYITGTRL